MKSKAKQIGCAAMVLFGLTAASLPAQSEIPGTNSQSLPTEPPRIKVERADKIIGSPVWTRDGKRLGTVDDLVVDLGAGRVLYAVVFVPGFLGIHDRFIAVPPADLKHSGDGLRLAVDKSVALKAPLFPKASNEPYIIQNPEYASALYEYYGQKPWWEGGGSVEFANVHRASSLIGTEVQNLSEKEIGRVNNVMVDLDPGRVPCVIFSPNSDLGTKNTLYALPPNALRRSPDGKQLISGVDRDKLASAPHFARDQWPDMSGPGWASSVYTRVGRPAYFENGELQPTARPTNNPPRIYHEAPK
jgi:sporulation protein YlmC with PRC-barrel domain